MRKQKMTIKEIKITMNMWAMAQSTIAKIIRKLEAGQKHSFRNGMIYNPKTQTLIETQTLIGK